MALNEAKEKVQKLETAIKKLDSFKKHLSHNATDIKGEIHSCVSHNLECLRGREVSLLNKVDEVVSLKEEALQLQQARLNQALGVLKTRMALTANSSLDAQMTEVLTKFNDIDLSPGETPHIAFRADHMSLRECILNYGRVDSNALPLQSAFDNPGKPSASLPRHLEEYEDVDHHIFYKTVEELKENNSTTKSITVSIPKLSTKMEDWLQKRFATDEVETTARPCDLSKKSCNSTVLKTPLQSTYTNQTGTCSLDSWLSHIKGHADQEEEHNFEIVDNSHGKKVNSGRTSSNYEDLKPWLLNTSDNFDNMMDTSPPSSQNIFHHIPSDIKFWLQQSQQQRSTVNDIKEKDMFSHISKDSSTWLRSRAHMRYEGKVNGIVNDRPVSFEDKNINFWLAQPSKECVVENMNNSNCQQISWLQKATHSPSPIIQEKKKMHRPSFQLEDICKANELCSSLSDCVCKPDCALAREQEMNNVKNPLDPTKVFKPTQLPMSQWLRYPEGIDDEKIDMNLDDAEDCKSNTGSVIGVHFDHFAHDDDDKWLIKPPEPTVEKVANPSFKHVKEEANLWVQQREVVPSSHEGENNGMTFNSTHMNKPLTEWLSAPTKLQEKFEEMKEDSEGWSICSSPTSFNSEQFSKDVYTAANYIDKWVM